MLSPRFLLPIYDLMSFLFCFLFRGGNPDYTPNQSMNFDGTVRQIQMAASDAKVLSSFPPLVPLHFLS